MSNVESTWELIASGDLFTDEKLNELQGEYAKLPPGQDDVLAWLVKQKVITDYHQKVFASGHSGPFRYGDYVVNDRISEGYFKGGFRAVHEKTQHPVVLSFVTEDDASVQWPRLKAVTHATQYFSSPFLVRCYEADESEDFKYLVFEDFDSVPITSILAKSGHLKPKTACDVIRRIAFALQTIHQAGYSHGHISSQHVRVHKGSVVKLFFDPNYFFVPLVKANRSPDPLSLVQVDYSAPELAIPTNRPDELTDIYALGCLFYELLVGKPPFPIGSIQDRMQQHATQRVKPLENLGYDKNLAQFVYFMMAKDRSLRFQSIEDVIRQLNSLTESGNRTPPPPKKLATEREFDQHIRAKLANENLNLLGTPTNLLSSGNVGTGNNDPVLDPPSIPVGESAQPAGNSIQADIAPEVSSDPSPASQPTFEQPAVSLNVDEQEANTTSSYRQRQKSSLKKTLTPVGITIAVLAIPLLLVYWKYGEQLFGPSNPGEGQQVAQKNPDGDSGSDPSNLNQEGGKNKQQSPEVSNVNLVEDDQRTLWEAPTQGEPIDLSLTPGGMRLLLSVRGESLFKQDTESLLAKSLGPTFQAQTAIFENLAGISWKETSRLNFSIHDNNVEGQDQLLGAFQVEPAEQKELVYWLAKWGDCTRQETGKSSYFNSSNGWSYYTPDNEKISRFLIGPESLIKEVAENGGGLPPLGMPQLLKKTDRDRHVNLLVVPTDLTSPSGVTLFNSTWIKLNQLMSWYMGGEDKIQAALLSLHFEGDGVYLETALKPQLDKDPFTLAEELRNRLKQAPNLVDEYMLDVEADRHWKKMARRIPDWVKSVASMSRVGVEDKITMTNCWQASYAAHNLLAALDYTLTFGEGGVTSAPPTTAAKKTPQNIEELLADVRTIEIANDDLNIAVDKIVAEVKDEYPKLPFDFKIVINGTHLMDEGITKNQRLVDFKVENKPLGDILADFVFQANTDKTSTGPSDPKTMLIWVIHKLDSGEKVVLITTRNAAAREGYQLPSQFVPK